MAGTKVAPFGYLGYWTNGRIVRIPGRKGFEKINSYYVKRYIKQVQEMASGVLHSKLPSFIKRFMDTAIVPGNIPWETGNLHDSIVAAVAYKKNSGSYSLAGGSAIHPHPVAHKKQRWGISIGGYEEHVVKGKHNRSLYYEGYGKEYAANYQDFARDPESNVIGTDIVIYFEATIPYSVPLEEDGPEAGWFDQLTEMFVDKLRTEVNVVTQNFDDFGGAMAYGIQYQIGF